MSPRDPRQRLTIVPCTIQDANAYVADVHRHHDPTVSGLFALAVVDEGGGLRGVAIVGRPVGRHVDNGWTCEVNRVATDGCDNACSTLYAAAWRAGRDLGWTAMLTYTLPSEGGASLRGAGWVLDEGGTYGGDEMVWESREHVVKRTESTLPATKCRWWAPGSCLPRRREHPTRGWAKRERETAQLLMFGRLG